MTHGWMAALLLAGAMDDVPPAPKGRLCLGERKTTLTSGSCTSTTGTAVPVAPSDTERLFVWTSDDQATAHLGVVAAKATQADLDPAPLATLSLSIAGDVSRGWPADVAMNFRGKEQWVWTLDAKAAPKLRKLVVPRGNARMQLGAQRHRRLVRTQIVASVEAVALGELRLLPIPAARGVVVDVEGKPIADAIVLRPDGSNCATANEQGAFVCELGEPAPEAVVVTRSGLGPRELSIPPQLDEDLDLGRITLSEGHTLTLKIVRPRADKARVTLYHDPKTRYDHSKLKTHELTEREEEVRFDVAEGNYLALVEGGEPLERLEVPIVVKDGDTEETISVVPYTLIGTVKFGEELLKEGTAEIVAPEHTWRANVPVRDGTFGGTMWQAGELSTFINSKEIGMGELVHSPKLGDDPSRWEVVIEKRMIVGRVLDAETKKPVPDAGFSLTAESDRRKFYTSVKIDPDGGYRILANEPGTYSMRVTSREHAVYSADVLVTNEDRIKTHDIVLERGVLQRLDIVTPAGAPVANALILEGVQPDGFNPKFMHHADARGQFSLRGRGGESRLLYVIPPDGSFAVVRVQMPREDAKPLQVMVPPAAGSLRVRTVDDAKQPVGSGLLLRYNGEFIPNAILRFVTGDTAHTHPTGEGVVPRLPAGTYELWALTQPGEEERLIASGGTLRAPVRAGLASGEQTVTVVAPPRPTSSGR